MVPAMVSYAIPRYRVVLTSVEEREWEVDESLLSPSLSAKVVLLYDVIDLTDSRRDQQAQDKCENVPVSRPEKDIDRVEEAKEGESPVDRVDDDVLASGRELEDHRAEEQEVDDGPHVERLESMDCIRGRAYIV